jgi:hypothetical protein
MPVTNSQSLVTNLLHSELIVSRQGGEDSPATHPAPDKPRALSGETQPGLELKSILRATLRAASQHVMRGHKAPCFRECSRPSCRNASNLIPHPVVVEKGVTDADLEVIFQRVLTAALEEVAAHPLSAQTPEWWNEPELVS